MRDQSKLKGSVVATNGTFGLQIIVFLPKEDVKTLRGFSGGTYSLLRPLSDHLTRNNTKVTNGLKAELEEKVLGSGRMTIIRMQMDK